MNQPLIYIIIPHKNGSAVLAACLSSLNQINYKNYRSVIVDDCSSDGSAEFVEANFSGTVVLRNETNKGFAASCNKGIKYALDKGADFVLLLNNDTEVNPDFLDKMLAVGRQDSVGIVGAKIYYFDAPERIWFGGGKFVWWRISGKHELWQKDDRPDYTGVIDSDFITGCAMLIKRQVFTDVGLLFEPYFLTIEDLDFSLEAVKKGWQIKTVLEAKIWHKVGYSRQGEFSFSNGYYGTRNRLHFALKRNKKYFGFFIFLFLVVPIRLIVHLALGQRLMARGVILGVKDFFAGKMGSF